MLLILLPNCFRKLEDGDIVNVDVTVYYKGVHGKKHLITSVMYDIILNNCLSITWCFPDFAGDLNETFFVGNVDETSRRLVQCTYECLEKAISIGWCFFL